ncbi:unnamed protein product [Porites evermanni]|uniref:Sushi domain-containing protein n=1 Tax=Porites evermanni TaxID=104178 RepID=A0ABN8SMZ3_9CNID|nr:unnamed protein product [Porites evermanni]
MSLHPCKISTLTFIDEIYVVNASFTVKGCPLYSPPQGGALVCTPPKGTYQPCAVMCRTGTDYVFSPPLVYFCRLSSAKWDYFSFFHFRATLPWPNCTAGGNPTSIKAWSQQYHYYDGDEHDPNVQATIKDKFHQLLMLSFMRPIFCQSDPGLCSKDELLVYPEINGKS